MGKAEIIFGQRLKKLRKECGLKIEELGKKIDLAYSSLSAIERGLHFPTLKTLLKICQALDTDLNYFFPFVVPKASSSTNKYDELYQLISELSPEELTFYTNLLKATSKNLESSKI